MNEYDTMLGLTLKALNGMLPHLEAAKAIAAKGGPGGFITPTEALQAVDHLNQALQIEVLFRNELNTIHQGSVVYDPLEANSGTVLALRYDENGVITQAHVAFPEFGENDFEYKLEWIPVSKLSGPLASWEEV